MSKSFRVWLVALCLLAACGSLVADTVSYIRFDGHRYSGGPSTGFDIAPDDLTAIGTALDIHAGVEGDEVFELRGVDRHHVVVMHSASSESDYWIFFRDGVLPRLPPGDDVDMTFPTVPGLCQYVEPAPSGCV